MSHITDDSCCSDFERGDRFTIELEGMRDVTRHTVYEVVMVDLFGLTFVDDANQLSVVHGNEVRQLSAARKPSKVVR